MFARNDYLAWAGQFYGKVPYDLALSGVAQVPIAELGDAGLLDDFGAIERARRSIAKYNDIPTPEVSPALGTSHALWLACASLLSPGDDVVLESPAYEPLWRVAEGVGARVVRFARPPEKRFAVDPADVAAAMTPRTKLVVVSDLHNPGGVPLGDDVLRDVARIAAARGAHVLVDEVYAPLDGLTDASGVWGKTARKLAPNVLAAGSLTKCYGLGAHRFGWLLGPTEIIERANDALVASTGHLPTSHAALACLAFSRIEDLAKRTRALLAGRREKVEAWIASRPELAWSAPKRGVFGFVHTQGSSADLRPVIEAGIEDHGVIVAAGSFFGVPNGFRLSWAHAGNDVDEALRRLNRVLDAAR
jgi:hypothetical protein